MKLVLVGLYCGPLLTLIPPLTQAKKRVSGNRVSDFRVSGGPPVVHKRSHFYDCFQLKGVDSFIDQERMKQNRLFFENSCLQV